METCDVDDCEAPGRWAPCLVFNPTRRGAKEHSVQIEVLLCDSHVLGFDRTALGPEFWKGLVKTMRQKGIRMPAPDHMKLYMMNRMTGTQHPVEK